MASITLFVFLLCLNWHGVTCQKHETAPIPDIMYGTAWKKERTAELVVSAVVHGFRAIDTAGQPKHYYEPGVGVALDFLYRNNVVKRSDLFLQTKYSPNYTPPEGDVGPTYVPYDPRASLEDQIRQSIASSLQNLRTNYLDSLVLHSPMGSVQETIRVWRVFEEYHQNGVILSLGISNCYDSNHLQQLYDAAAVKPRFIQNRFYKDSGYDTQIREFGGIHNIKYQSFWTLGANRNILESDVCRELAAKHGKTVEQIMFRFLNGYLGILPLSGTKSPKHMMDDLAITSMPVIRDVTFTSEELNRLNAFLTPRPLV